MSKIHSILWVTRDKDGFGTIWGKKPYRSNERWTIGEECLALSLDNTSEGEVLGNLTWEDEPIKRDFNFTKDDSCFNYDAIPYFMIQNDGKFHQQIFRKFATAKEKNKKWNGDIVMKFNFVKRWYLK